MNPKPLFAASLAVLAGTLIGMLAYGYSALSSRRPAAATQGTVKGTEHPAPATVAIAALGLSFTPSAGCAAVREAVLPTAMPVGAASWQLFCETGSGDLEASGIAVVALPLPEGKGAEALAARVRRAAMPGYQAAGEAVSLQSFTKKRYSNAAQRLDAYESIAAGRYLLVTAKAGSALDDDAVTAFLATFTAPGAEVLPVRKEAPSAEEPTSPLLSPSLAYP